MYKYKYYIKSTALTHEFINNYYHNKSGLYLLNASGTYESALNSKKTVERHKLMIELLNDLNCSDDMKAPFYTYKFIFRVVK